MLKFVIFVIFAVSLAIAQDEAEEICQGQEDGTLIGIGADISCTEYYYCQEDYGFLDNCLDEDEDFQFDYNTNTCRPYAEVLCEDPQPVEPDTEEPEPEPTDPPTRQTVVPTTTGPNNNVPDVECPTNRPGEIVFFPSSNCSEYFICANGFRMKMSCMEGFTWNQEERQCDFPIYSKCSQNIVDDGLTVRCLRNGFYSTGYPRDCTKFVFCSAGIPMVQNCPIGHAWHIDRCVMRQFASCPDLRRMIN